MVEREPSPGWHATRCQGPGERVICSFITDGGRAACLQHSFLGRGRQALMAFGPHTYSHGNKSSQWAKFSICKALSHPASYPGFKQPWCEAGPGTAASAAVQSLRPGEATCSAQAGKGGVGMSSAPYVGGTWHTHSSCSKKASGAELELAADPLVQGCSVLLRQRISKGLRQGQAIF